MSKHKQKKALVLELYASGLSINQVATQVNASRSTVRRMVVAAGIVRPVREAVLLSIANGAPRPGRKKGFVVSEAERIRLKKISAETWAKRGVKGFRVTPTGYIEFTTGPNKGRLQHVVLFEDRLGRGLLDDEVVHHIDGDGQNNNMNNLALMTRGAHAKLHRREDGLAGRERKRNEIGQFK